MPLRDIWDVFNLGKFDAFKRRIQYSNANTTFPHNPKYHLKKSKDPPPPSDCVSGVETNSQRN